MEGAAPATPRGPQLPQPLPAQLPWEALLNGPDHRALPQPMLHERAAALGSAEFDASGLAASARQPKEPLDGSWGEALAVGGPARDG